MENLVKLNDSLWATDNTANVLSFVSEQERKAMANNSRFVKTYFINNDWVLALHDGVSENKQTMLFWVKDFPMSEDTLIQLAAIFYNATAATSTYNILKVARQATEEAIAIIPTFQALFHEESVTPLDVKLWVNTAGKHHTELAA